VFFCGALHAGWGDFLESSGGAGNEKDARQVSGHCVFLNVRISLRGFVALAGRPQHSVSALKMQTHQTRGQCSFSFIFSLRVSLSSVGFSAWREVFDWNLKGLFTM
jgi:hypothetical protein